MKRVQGCGIKLTSAYQKTARRNVEKRMRIKTVMYCYKYIECMYRAWCRILWEQVIQRTKLYRSFDKRHGGFDKQNEYFGEMTCSNTHV